MEYTNTEIIIRIAHISELLKSLSTELDKMYKALTEKTTIEKGE